MLLEIDCTIPTSSQPVNTILSFGGSNSNGRAISINYNNILWHYSLSYAQWGFDIPSGTRVKFRFVSIGSTIALYINNDFIGSCSLSLLQYTGETWIGSNQSASSQYYSGILYELKISAINIEKIFMVWFYLKG